MGCSLKLQSKVFALALGLASVSGAYFAWAKPGAPGSAAAPGAIQNLSQDPGLITGTKQITFVGPRSGEGYFSADGRKMIFQSERRDGNPFYQIYLMDLETGKTNLVSTGKGKTTCAWIHPDNKKVLFSSTHHDPDLKKKVQEEFESRRSAQKAKYSWSFDESFSIYTSDLNGKNLRRLTKEKGYNAEGAYSPDGQWIVFASNRAAYSAPMSEDDRKIFEKDPSYMMDIYIMKADGSGVHQLTTARGYDGGPFFSADGKKITWRRFTPNGQSAEIFTMNVDGSDQKPLTKLNSMSWAPFFHPSGDYVIFTSNILGFSNFELFIVDAKGEKDPVRVSYLDGFDGLPVFTPDGQKISWTRRNEKGESQIYMAQWNDAKARELLGLAPSAPTVRTLTSKDLNVRDVKAWIQYLASPQMNGRATGSLEEKEYAARLSEAFKAMGLVPALGNDFIVPFEFTSGVELGSKNELKIQAAGKDTSFKVSEDFIPLSFSKNGEAPAAPVVFAGYGIHAPASDNQPEYDSYKGLDAKGKWVLIFRDIPEDIANEKRVHLNRYSRLHHKARIAKQNGAVGLLVVNGPNVFNQKLAKLRFEGGFAETSLPVLSVSNKFAETLLKSSGQGLKAWQDANDKGEIATWGGDTTQVAGAVDLILKKSQGLNVVAQLPVRGAQSSVVIGGHGDHLGRGEMGSSLAKNEDQGGIHYGADDNASGVSAVMEIAQSVSEKHRSGKLPLKQNLIFGVWSGEEIGLLGSTAYLKNNKDKLTAYLNMDMIGRLRENLSVQGVASAKEWRPILETLAATSEVALSQQDDPYVPTDGMQFYLQGIPSLTFFTGAHSEYHTPRDRVETLNLPGIVQVASLVEKLGVRLASSAQPLTYEKVESSKKQMEGRSFRIFLGTIPDYTQEGVKGVKISGTSKDSPAEKAGLRPGDVIVEMASTKVENLYDYVYLLQALKPNVQTGIRVSRGGKILELVITPALKE
jgi:Tol biopolymer transport system component